MEKLVQRFIPVVEKQRFLMLHLFPGPGLMLRAKAGPEMVFLAEKRSLPYLTLSLQNLALLSHLAH